MAKAQKWQYQVTPPSGGLEQLNALGDEGWELTAVDEYWCYLKRPRPRRGGARSPQAPLQAGSMFERPKQ